MFIAILGHKGGVGKTTTAIHLAAALHQEAPTLLIDADPNRSAIEWARRGNLPFQVLGPSQAVRQMKDHAHAIFDTKARLDRNELQELAEGADLIILPTSPDSLALHGLLVTIGELQNIGATHFRILLSIVPPLPNRDGAQARVTILDQGMSVFENQIRRFVAFQRAALSGTTVDQIRDGNSEQAWRDVLSIRKEVLK